ncbi:MAG TPA: hypothetical protein VG652_03565 [Gaiellaceae bacterium]|nr:hypothetical protein [Gaiellaceae bacterium]
MSSVEPDAVLSWRFDQLDAAGYPEAAMLLLGQRTDIDLHLATSLLRNGCPIETALHILL